MFAFLAFLRRLRHICRKEMLVILKDPANRIILVMPIIVQSLIFGYAATYDLTDIPYVVADQSRSALSRDFLARLDGSGIFHRAATLDSPAQTAAFLDSGQAMLAVNIGPDFERRLLARQDAPVQVILDGRNSTTAGVALTYLNSVCSAFNRQRGFTPRVELMDRAWFNPQLETRWNILPGMIVSLGMIQILVLSALSVAREREQGTFDQMLVTPLSPLEILIGKAVPPIVIGVVQATLVQLICMFWFRIPFYGSFLSMYVTFLIFTLSCAGIGLSVSAVSRTMYQAIVYCFVLLLPSILLSGLATPIRAMPQALQIGTYVNPLRFGIECVRRIYLENGTLTDIAPLFVPMLAVAAVTLPLAGWLFRHRLA